MSPLFSGVVDALLRVKTAALLVAFSLVLSFAVIKWVQARNLERQLTAAVNASAGLAARLETQNEGIRLLKRAAEQQLTAARAANSAAARAAQSAAARAAQITARPAPATCEAAIQFLVNDAASAQ